MRADGDQAKTACGNLQLCAVLKDGIEGETHTVEQRRLERVKMRRSEEEDGSTEGEEESQRIADTLNNLAI